MTKEIGGYFCLELHNRGNMPHKKGIFLNSGSNALEYILRSLYNIKCVWIPYFTCSIISKPFKNTNIPYKFYRINEHLELADDIRLDDGEYILVTNYYGIKDSYIQMLSKKYKGHVIVDNAQAFFAHPIANVPTVYSPRKFIGIPDGGIAYGVNTTLLEGLDTAVSYDRCSHLLKRYDIGAGAAYDDFKTNDRALALCSMKKMSIITRMLLNSIDYNEVLKRRQANLAILHDALESTNKYQIPDSNTYKCPLVYPYFTSKGKELKEYLIKHKIFCATYWPNVFDWCKPTDIEYKIADNMVCLPIDQRYDKEDMYYIIKTIKQYES